MDAKERLRRYLEQRREMGESELILDRMPVEDVMAMLSTRPGAPRPRAPRVEASPEAAVSDAAASDQTAPKAAATEPESTLKEPQQPPERVAERPRDVAPDDPATTPPGAIAPVEPPRRFDADSSTDWRETLRRAGAMRPDSSSEPRAEPRANAASDSPASVSPTAKQSDVVPPSLLPLDAVAGTADDPPAWLTALGLPLGVSSGRASSAALEPAIAELPTLEALAEMVRICTRCDLYKTAINPVPGEGNPHAEFVCVGEAPGQNEDEQGRPFVGAAGSLLNKILGAIQLQRDDVFICNVLKHRPPGNRDPLPNEVKACEPYLRRQLELIKPRVILALGRFAAQSLLQTTTPIGKLRGQLHRYHGIPLIVTYHPAALLRNESWKRPTWEDVKLARRILDASRAASAP
jgi:DNA polymerase